MELSDKESLAAEYALGTLRGAERTAFERQMTGDAALNALVDQWYGRLGTLESLVPVKFGSLSDEQVDAALDSVFSRIEAVLDQEMATAPAGLKRPPNPFASLSLEQKAKIRPAVVKLLASYMVLIERLRQAHASMTLQPAMARAPR
jgi:anti-sigma-K factor RskA